jgi:hypothetical protein
MRALAQQATPVTSRHQRGVARARPRVRTDGMIGFAVMPGVTVRLDTLSRCPGFLGRFLERSAANLWGCCQWSPGRLSSKVAPVSLGTKRS